MNILHWIIYLIGLLICIKIYFFRVMPFITQYVFTSELDLPKRYGKGNWVLITGPSSGMGERFAYEFADREFNLLLVGSKRTKGVIRAITKLHPKIDIKFIEVDFANSFKDDFFDVIQDAVDSIGVKWSVLINNVGYRTAAPNYCEMSIEEMKKTIAVGTLVQSKLIQMALQKFSTYKTHTAIVNITALNSFTTDLFAVNNDVTVPYLACYEAANAYGYYHAKSVHSEIKDKYQLIDFLIIMPGAVLTKNRTPVLNDTIFAVDAETYVKNIIKLMGNYQGPMCSHYGHSLSSALINLVPFVDTETIMRKVGSDFANQKIRQLNADKSNADNNNVNDLKDKKSLNMSL